MKLLSILIISSLSISMEVPKAICYLARLPVEVQNLIGEYLIVEESDEEFITRNSALGWGSDYHREAQHYKRINGAFSTDSEDFCYRAYYNRSSRHGAQLLVKHKDETLWDSYPQLARDIYDDQEYSQIVDIAISIDGKFFAKMAQKKKENSWVEIESGWNSYTYSYVKITVFQLHTKAKKEFSIPIPMKAVFFVDINKQNTKVITHGKDERCDYKYFIFEFNREYEKTDNRLNDYFKRHRVCKKLARSLQAQRRLNED